MRMNFEKREVFTFFLTLGLWTLFLIFSLIIKIDSPKPEYPLIELRLNEEIKPKVTTTAQSSVSSTTTQTTTQTQTKQEQPQAKPKTVTKTTPAQASTKSTAKTESKPVTKESKPVIQQNLVPSMESLMEENSKAKKEAVWDESVFDNGSVSTSVSKNSEVIPKMTTGSLSGFSGSAATSSKDVGASSSSKSSTDSSSSTSSFTQDALAAIKGSTIVFSDNTTGAVQETSGEMSQDSQGVNFELQDGSKRRLLQPAKPVITISEENQKLLKGSVQVSILFTVTSQGIVPISSIEIQPAGLLPIEIQNEIKTQIKSWLFEEKKSDGHAYLNYSIKKE